MAVDIDSIKALNPLPVIVERFTGQQIVKHKIHCPLHEDKTPSMHIYDDGGFKCFSCGAHGDSLDFVGYFHFGTNYNPSVHFTQVVDIIGGINIKPLPAQTTKPKPEPTKQLSISLETILDWHDSMPANRREYWKSRGLFDQTINDFFLGWDGERYVIPALYRLVPFAAKRRIADEAMNTAKIKRASAITLLRQQHPDWTDTQIEKIAPELPPKYISVTGSKSGLFNEDCLWTTDKVVVTEGEIDAMLLTQWGFPAVSSTSGAGTFKDEWASKFLFVPKVWVLYDNDDAGRKGEQLVHASIRRAKIMHYPQGIKDTGDLFEKDPQAVNWLYENLV